MWRLILRLEGVRVIWQVIVGVGSGFESVKERGSPHAERRIYVLDAM